MKRKLQSILALLLMAVTQSTWAQVFQPLTLEARTNGVHVSVSVPRYGTIPSSMKYQIKTGEKAQVAEGTEYELNRGDIIKFYGTADSYNGVTISCDDDCYVYGNVMSLVDEENFENATVLTGDHAFFNLFSGNSNLYSHPDYELVLPATILTDCCYEGMFYGCENLTIAPELPATTLAEGCYKSMFSYCTSLTSAPGLFAETLEDYCYSNKESLIPSTIYPVWI